jgi:hypothetical protein
VTGEVEEDHVKFSVKISGLHAEILDRELPNLK